MLLLVTLIVLVTPVPVQVNHETLLVTETFPMGWFVVMVKLVLDADEFGFHVVGVTDNAIVIDDTKLIYKNLLRPYLHLYKTICVGY